MTWQRESINRLHKEIQEIVADGVKPGNIGKIAHNYELISTLADQDVGIPMQTPEHYKAVGLARASHCIPTDEGDFMGRY
jgi:hypothetical protein